MFCHQSVKMKITKVASIETPHHTHALRTFRRTKRILTSIKQPQLFFRDLQKTFDNIPIY